MIFFLSLQSMFDGAYCLSNGFIFSLFVIVFFFKYSYALKILVKPYWVVTPNEWWLKSDYPIRKNIIYIFFYFTVRTWLVLRTRLYRIHTNSEVYIIFPCLDTYHKPGPPTPTFLKTIPCLKSTCWPQLHTLFF